MKNANTPELRQNVKTMQNKLKEHNITTERKPLFLAASIASGITDEKERYDFLDLTTATSKEKNSAYTLSKATPYTGVEQGDVSAVKHWAHKFESGNSIRDWVILESSKGNSTRASKILTLAEKHGVADGPEKDFIKGEDVLALDKDRRAGTWVRNTLSAMRDAQYKGKFTNHDEALIWLKKHGISE